MYLKILFLCKLAFTFKDDRLCFLQVSYDGFSFSFTERMAHQGGKVDVSAINYIEKRLAQKAHDTDVLKSTWIQTTLTYT